MSRLDDIWNEGCQSCYYNYSREEHDERMTDDIIRVKIVTTDKLELYYDNDQFSGFHLSSLKA